jgi:hypothetical protein
MDEDPDQGKERLPQTTGNVNVSGNPMVTFGGMSVGDRFGRLTALHRTENRGRHACWECKCECGPEHRGTW